jgi:hypothetical protein
VISSHAPSPGPGHYTGLSVDAFRHTASSPPRHDPIASKATMSPGCRGYSFGKARVPKCEALEALDQTAYEFKSTNNVVGSYSPKLATPKRNDSLNSRLSANSRHSRDIDML